MRGIAYSSHHVQLYFIQFFFKVAAAFSSSHSAFPPIRTDAQRLSYKREFENTMVEYKKMQADLDNVTRRLADLDKQLDTLPEDSADYQVS